MHLKVTVRKNKTKINDEMKLKKRTINERAKKQNYMTISKILNTKYCYNNPEFIRRKGIEMCNDHQAAGET